MMKSRLLVFTLLLSLLSYAQQGTITIDWVAKSRFAVTYDVVFTIPQFNSSNMVFDHNKKQLLYSIAIPSSSAIDERSLQITNISYESISRDELGDLAVASIPVAINAKAGSKKARDSWYTVISLFPIIKEGNSYKKVKSFSYSVSSDLTVRRSFTPKEGNIITNSVLASGEWYRFYVEKSGVYKVSKSFLQQLGFNTGVDPRQIKIYGNGGRMVPLLNSTAYPEDMAENAISFIGEEDGVFNDSDYILFYAEGVDNWSQENGTHNNLYANRSYYYVTSQGGAGKRIGQMIQPDGPANATITSFDEYVYYEKDLVNIARLGRKWHGEQFNVENQQNFSFTIPDIDPSAPVNVKVSAAANSVVSTSMSVTANGQNIGSASFAQTGDHDAAEDITGGSFEAVFNAAGSEISIGLTYNNNGVPGSNAWLDYIVLQPKRFLKGNGKQFRFRYNAAAGDVNILQYQFSNASGISHVWDITNIYDVVGIVNAGSATQFNFKAQGGTVRQYIAVVPSDYYTPLRESQSRVANQNLKGTILKNSQGQFQDLDYLIVTPSFLNAQAEKLANIHRSQNLTVKVVNLENIYQEFSSGKQDIGAIRNFIRYIYSNASSAEGRIKYVNMFGDASFDFKDRIPSNTNIVPILHAYDPNGGIDNYSTVVTFCSDDFFVLMDLNEGPMLANDNLEAPDIAIGRMLVSSTAQAEEMINKVVEYKNPEAYGRWRNEYVMIGDDLDGGTTTFVDTLERIYNDIVANRPFVNVRKVYTDSYVQEASSGGFRYPQAKEQIISSINYGSLVVNYLGHGGESGMASERIFESSDAQELTNKYKYPLFITATCELTRFDNPYRQTAGEFLYWNPAGGAISLVTTTRSIFVSAAYNLNESLVAKLYAFGGDVYPTMAEALRQSKAEETNPNLRLVAFIGDPALMLAVPKPKIELTEVNDIPVGQTTPVLEALSYVKLEGRVTDEAGNPLNSYGGELEVTVFDKAIERQTLGNDGVTTGGANPVLIIDNFTTLGEAIFRGNASVANGRFEFGFVVPRDIRIPVAAGRVSFYSKKNNVLEDHTGFDSTIQVGGINANAEEDTTGPTVRLYMNDESFISGGITNDSPIFLAFLFDEHGINTASGIGHDIVAILDGDENNPYLLNDYYETELDDYTRGTVRFPFRDLEPGLHTLTFKAWDVYNNLVTAEIQFVVAGDEELKLEKVLNYPNPFVSYTEFWFSHNRPFEPLDVQVQIFTVTGKVVKTINQSVSTDGFLCRDIKWDGRDDFGDKIGKGVYIYKLTVRSSTTNKTAEKYEKLVLL